MQVLNNVDNIVWDAQSPQDPEQGCMIHTVKCRLDVQEACIQISVVHLGIFQYQLEILQLTLAVLVLAKSLLWLTENAMLFTIVRKDMAYVTGPQFVYCIQQCNGPIIGRLCRVSLFIEQECSALLPCIRCLAMQPTKAEVVKDKCMHLMRKVLDELIWQAIWAG